jgi:hypothetical protein
LFIYLFKGRLKPLWHRRLGIFRWKRFQGKVETISGLGGKEFRDRCKEIQGQVEGVSRSGGKKIRAKFL